MLFRKRDKRGEAQVRNKKSGRTAAPPELYRIDFDMMMKGNVFKRRPGPVRQVGVTVRGATHVVTSGDVVDRETFLALLEANAIRPVAPAAIHDESDGDIQGAQREETPTLHPEIETPREE